MVESSAVCHERCRSQDTIAVCMNNARIYLVREAEIIGVDDEALQSEDVQLNFQELLRIRSEILQESIQLAGCAG